MGENLRGKSLKEYLIRIVTAFVRMREKDGKTGEKKHEIAFNYNFKKWSDSGG